MKPSHATGLAAALVVVASSTAAHAQPVERLRQGVAERDRPAYAARGIRTGSFILYPSIEESIVHNDNIFATDGGKVDDWILETRPELRVESNFSRHALYFEGGARNLKYFDNSSENHTDYAFGGGARVDIRRILTFNTDAKYEKGTEDRSSPDAVGAALEPVRYRHLEVNPELRYRPGRLSVTLGGALETYKFDNVAIQGGGFQNNKDRDRKVTGGYIRTALEVSPGYELFVQGLYNNINYDNSLDDAGFDRDSNGYEVMGGMRFEITNVITGEAAVGYTSRDYSDPRLKTISGVASEVGINWYVTRLTTLNFKVSRKIQETTLFGAAGYLNTTFEVGVDHELMRNLVLSASGSYQQQKFDGIGRTDTYWEGRARAMYLLNRNLSVGGEYRRESRSSDALFQDYGRNIFLLTFRGQI